MSKLEYLQPKCVSDGDMDEFNYMSEEETQNKGK